MILALATLEPKHAVACVMAIVCAFALAATLASGPAHAQGAFREPRFQASPFKPTPPVDPFDWRRPNPRAQSVVNRPRPELDALGLPAGPVRIYPSLTAGVIAEDNVLRSKQGRRSDLAFVASPSLYLIAERQRGRLELAFDADIYAYARTGSEDREDFNLALSGQREIATATALAAKAAFGQTHELRSSPDIGGAGAPIELREGSAGLAVLSRFGRAGLVADAQVRRLDYDDVIEAGGARFLNNDDRDRTEARIGLEPEFWNPADDARVYARMEGVGIAYDDDADDGGFGRDSRGVDLRLGLEADLTGKTAAEVHIGYAGRFYEDNGPTRLNSDAVEAFLVGGALTWNVTTLSSVNARLDRALFETTLAGSPGGVISRLDVGVDHELLRNFVLSAGVGGRVLDFEGVDRDDYGLLFRLGGVYMLNRHFGLEAGFEHERIGSSGAQSGVDHSVNRLMLRATARP